MTITPELYPNTSVLGRTSFSQESTARPVKVKTINCVASVSHGDTCMMLESINGIFRIVLMWGTNTRENAGNPDEGAFIDRAYGITYEELLARAYVGTYVFRQGSNWKLEVDVCDVFTEFIFTPQGHEPTSLSVSMDILYSLDADSD